MQKILYLITQAELGGAQRYVFDLANNLNGEFEISIASGNKTSENKFAEKLAKKNINYYEIKRLKRTISPINDFLALLEIIKLIKKIKPDIIHLNSSKISILGSLASFIIKINPCNWKLEIRNWKLIYTVHGWVFNEPMSVWKKLFYKYTEKFTARFKDKIICVSRFDHQTALKEKICSSKKLITIHNGIEKINFPTKEEAKNKLESLIQNSIPKFRDKIQNSIKIGSIGHLYKTKGYEYLIDAIKILVTNYQLPVAAVIIGQDEGREKLEKLIRQNNLENNIILAGQIKNADELLPAFDLYACSSVKEGFPYTILEAMSTGLPIVASKVGGIPEMIEDKKDGLLVEPQNAKELAEKIKMLIDNKTAREQYGAKAKDKVAKEFSLEKMIAETKKLYLK